MVMTVVGTLRLISHNRARDEWFSAHSLHLFSGEDEGRSAFLDKVKAMLAKAA
ncbi:hypothetical protein EGR_04898 [Echinococcus granulosus]|uniref:Uncharacterized protein n=1 Tax=Echinococcus granulosus TaxID=6210 RepID=W6UGS6_ECHGR|nr:hypothetical protein EGR_04898 [Echinococcus granulosus]EUB60188.1 hypothetical protein EGR_04898 [Echinococcus granulosus]